MIHSCLTSCYVAETSYSLDWAPKQEYVHRHDAWSQLVRAPPEDRHQAKTKQSANQAGQPFNAEGESLVPAKPW